MSFAIEYTKMQDQLKSVAGEDASFFMVLIYYASANTAELFTHCAPAKLSKSSQARFKTLYKSVLESLEMTYKKGYFKSVEEFKAILEVLK